MENRVSSMGLLVHELVHHVQHYNGLITECEANKERLAYHIQYMWLRQVAGLPEDSIEINHVKLLYLHYTSLCDEQ